MGPSSDPLLAQTAGAAAPTGAPPASRLTVRDVQAPIVPLDRTHPRQLSGLTWAGGDRFFAVSDSRAVLYPYTIAIDPADGRVRSISLGEPVPLRDADGNAWRGGDLEGVAFDPATGNVWVADEAQSTDITRAIGLHRPDDGRLVSTVDVQAPGFRRRNVRGNAGLESLSLAGRMLWTANEDALSSDGPGAGGRTGAMVRLTRIDLAGTVAQWAYPVESPTGALPTGGRPMSGVVDLVALEDGRVLVLERATSGSRGPGDIGGFISRLFLADVSGATDIARLPALADLRPGRDYDPVRKTLLWSRYFSLFGGPNNFEGLALGPALADGSRSLLLIADNDVLPSTLLALRLEGGQQ
jgi:hypothetical protein